MRDEKSTFLPVLIRFTDTADYTYFPYYDKTSSELFFSAVFGRAIVTWNQ